MKHYLIAAGFGLLIGLGCLPGLLRDAGQFCDLGFKICVHRHGAATLRLILGGLLLMVGRP
jgi:hypothetical protein